MLAKVEARSSLALAVALTAACAAETPHLRALRLEQNDTANVAAVLFDSEWKVAASAAKLLGERHDAASIPSLVDAVNRSRDWQVRAYAANALGRFSSDQAVDCLAASAKNDPNIEVRTEAVGALGAMSNPDLAVLVLPFISSPEHSLAERVQRELIHMSPTAKLSPDSLRAASDALTGHAGDFESASKFWIEWKASAGGASNTPRIDHELQRLVELREAAMKENAANDARKTEQARQEAQLSAEKALEQRQLQVDALKRWEAEQEERTQKRQAAVLSAERHLKAGEFEQAVASIADARSLGADVSAVARKAASVEWRRNAKQLTGASLQAFIERWGNESPEEAQSRFQKETPARERAAFDVDARTNLLARLNKARYIWLPTSQNWVNTYGQAMGTSDPKKARGFLREAQIQGLVRAQERAAPTMQMLIHFSHFVEELAQGDDCAEKNDACARGLSRAEQEFNAINKDLPDQIRAVVRDRQEALR